MPVNNSITHNRINPAVVPALLLTLTIVGGILVPLILPIPQLQNLLARLAPLTLHLCTLFLIAGLYLESNSLVQYARDLPRRTKLAIGTILLTGLSMVVFAAPRLNRIMYDEHIYQNIAQAITYLGKAWFVIDGKAEFGNYTVSQFHFNKQPAGFPYYLSLIFQLAGVQEWAAHLANNIAYAAGVLAVFALGILLFESTTAALFSSLYFAFTPEIVLWSNTAAAEPATATFGALAVLGAVSYKAKPCAGRLLIFIALTSLSFYFRPESLLLIAPISLVFFINDGHKLKVKEILWPVVLVLVLSLAELWHLFCVRNDPWGSSGERFSLELAWQNLRVNGSFYFNNEWFPALFTCLGVAGCLFGRGSNLRHILPVWFVLLWGVFLFFYAGSYKYGADVRYSLVSAAPLALMAGQGAVWTGERFDRLFGLARGKVFVLIISLWAAVTFLPLIRSEGEEGIWSRLDIRHSREFVDLIPTNSLVLTHNPSAWLIWGKNAAQTHLATTNSDRVHAAFANYHGGVYFHWNYWCNLPIPEQIEFCQNILKRYDYTLLAEKTESNYRFALYRIFPKQPSANAK